MNRSIVLRMLTALVAAAALGACAITEPDAPAASIKDVDPKAPGGYLDRGPTLTLDEQARLADPTTLQLLEKRSQDLAQQKKRVEELEAALAARTGEVNQLKEDVATRVREKEQIETLLKESIERERAAVEQALGAEIARLKIEQELLKLQLGELVKDKD